MPDIVHEFPINKSAAQVFAGMVTPAGLDQWWTKTSRGKPKEGEEYDLDFGPEYQWKAEVARCVPDRAFEWRMTKSDSDWEGSRVGFELREVSPEQTIVKFYHKDWPQNNEHYRISSFCWAMYLRILKRNLEFGEIIPYEDRLNV